MTLVIGTLLDDGAMLAADCRVTWTGPSGPVYTDVAQKLIKFSSAPAHLFGFAGDLPTVQLLLPHIAAQFERRRTDAMSVWRWLPRFLRTAFRAAARMYSIDSVEFIVAASVPNRPAIVSP